MPTRDEIQQKLDATFKDRKACLSFLVKTATGYRILALNSDELVQAMDHLSALGDDPSEENLAAFRAWWESFAPAPGSVLDLPNVADGDPLIDVERMSVYHPSVA